MKDFSKKYDHGIESEIYKIRMDKNAFAPQKPKNKNKDNNKFMISMPPPNVTGVLHLGHSLMLVIEDMLVRYNRMEGKETLYIPGTDHAGIATQVVVERKLYEESKKTRYDLGREKFLLKVWDWVKYSRSTIVSQLKAMGASCDWSKEQFTLSEKLSRSVRKSFVSLAEKGKIYRGMYIINWCPRCQTVLSDIEVNYDEEKAKLYYIRYFIEGKGDSIPVATIRPETIFGDVAVAVNPKDKRYKKYIGKQVLIPIINKAIPVIADEEVDVLFGTGALKITPTHDPVDYEIGKRHDLPLDQFAIDKDGNFTDLAGEFAHKQVDEVLNNIIQYLKEIGNLDKIEEYDTRIPSCDRCGTRNQPMVSNQWFVDVAQSAKDSMESVNNGTTEILPARFNKTYFEWLEKIKPWCISRQLRWGHRIPVRHCNKGHLNILDDEKFDTGSKYDIINMIVFNLIADSRLPTSFCLDELITLLLSDSLTPQEGKIYQVYRSIYSIKYKNNPNKIKQIEQFDNIMKGLEKDTNNLFEKASKLIDILEGSDIIESKGDKFKFAFVCEECGAKNLKQDEDVLDTWFSSALWPFSILGWPEDTDLMKKYYPNTVLETGYDILFFWVARMMMMGQEALGKAPFDKVYLHGLVRTEKGEKMSKSKGNVVDPMKIIDKYGADSLRLSLLIGTTPGNDTKFSIGKVEYSWRFINKLWNAVRFIHLNYQHKNVEKILNYDELHEDIQKNTAKLNDFDKWILDRVNCAIFDCNKYNEKFMLGEAAQTIINTTWHDMCDWYIEISKLSGGELTNKVLILGIGTLLKLLHPYIPFVTEKLRSNVNFDDLLISSSSGKTIDIGEKNYKLNLFMEIITEFRNLRQKLEYKPHEKINVFVQGNTKLHTFIKNNENVFKTLINAEDIQYLLLTDQLNPDFEVSLVLDVKVGIQGIHNSNLNEKIELLEKSIFEENQFLQNIRNLLSNDGFLSNASKDIIQEKYKKIDEVKSKIVHLEHELNRLKMIRK